MPNIIENSVILEDISPKDLEAMYEELGVTEESVRKGAAVLREWINDQPHLPNLTKDYEKWLESFLLVSKNSMEKATQRVDKYFTMRAAHEDWICLPPIEKEGDMWRVSEYFHHFWLPQPLPGGYNMVVSKIAERSDFSGMDWNSHYWRDALLGDMFVGTAKRCRGLIIVVDMKNVSFSFTKSMLMSSMGYVRKSVQIIQGGLPLRIHSLHLINCPARRVLRTLLSATTPLLKDKLSERIVIHDNLETLHNTIPPQYLPVEYNGTLPISTLDLTHKSNKTLANKREWFESRRWMMANEEKRPKK